MKFYMLIIALVLIGFPTAYSQTIRHAFPDFEEFPLLYEAMSVDPLFGDDPPFNRPSDELNMVEAIQGYEQFIGETELEPWREATILANIGKMYNMISDQPEIGFYNNPQMGLSFYERAITLAPRHVSWSLIVARSHIIYIPEDNKLRLDNYIDAQQWRLSLTEEEYWESAYKELGRPSENATDSVLQDFEERYEAFINDCKKSINTFDGGSGGKNNYRFETFITIAERVPGGLERLVNELPGTNAAALAQEKLEERAIINAEWEAKKREEAAFKEEVHALITDIAQQAEQDAVAAIPETDAATAAQQRPESDVVASSTDPDPEPSTSMRIPILVGSILLLAALAFWYLRRTRN